MPSMTLDQLDARVKDVVGSTVAAAVNEALAKFTGSRVNPIDGIVGGESTPPDVKKGAMIGQMIRALAAGKGDPERAASWAKKVLGAEGEAVAKALSTDDATAGGVLVRPNYANEVIELLRPQSAVMALQPTIIQMGAASFLLPKLSGGASASYIGEGVDIPVTQPTTGDVRLIFKKLAALVPVTNDMMRYAAPGSETIIRDDLVAALRQRSDLAFIRNTGVGDTPRGLRYQAPGANVIPANGTVNLANVTFDLGQLILTLLEADVRMIRPGWIMAPRSAMYLMTVRDGNGNYAFRDEMMAGRLWGYPYKTTTQIPTNLGGGSNQSEIYFADFADVVIGEAMGLALDISTEASFIDENSQLVSAFSKDLTVVRAILEHDMAVRHNASVAVLTEVTWAP